MRVILSVPQPRRAAAGNELHKDRQSQSAKGRARGIGMAYYGGVQLAASSHKLTTAAPDLAGKKERLKSVYNARCASTRGCEKLYAKCAFNSLVVAQGGGRGKRGGGV